MNIRRFCITILALAVCSSVGYGEGEAQAQAQGVSEQLETTAFYRRATTLVDLGDLSSLYSTVRGDPKALNDCLSPLLIKIDIVFGEAPINYAETQKDKPDKSESRLEPRKIEIDNIEFCSIADRMIKSKNF